MPSRSLTKGRAPSLRYAGSSHPHQRPKEGTHATELNWRRTHAQSCCRASRSAEAIHRHVCARSWRRDRASSACCCARASDKNCARRGRPSHTRSATSDRVAGTARTGALIGLFKLQPAQRRDRACAAARSRSRDRQPGRAGLKPSISATSYSQRGVTAAMYAARAWDWKSIMSGLRLRGGRIGPGLQFRPDIGPVIRAQVPAHDSPSRCTLDQDAELFARHAAACQDLVEVRLAYAAQAGDQQALLMGGLFHKRESSVTLRHFKRFAKTGC